MTGVEVLPPAILQRKAVVYVRQSTPGQIEANAEGRRRQYELRTSIYPSSAGFGALTAHRKRVTGTLSLGLAPVLGIAA